MKIFRYDIIDSTNSECFRKFEKGEPCPFAVISAAQTNGRGQFGRRWYSDSRQNIYASFAFVPSVSVENFKNFSIIFAEHVVNWLNEELAINLRVKFPNDIYFEDKKVGGILTESIIRENKIAIAVTGIGLNVGINLSEFPEDLRLIATSLGQISAKDLDLKFLENGIIKIMEQLAVFM